MSKNYPTLKNLVPLFFLLFSIAAFSQTFSDYTPNGTETFNVPTGVTQLTVQVWGAGGAGCVDQGRDIVTYNICTRFKKKVFVMLI